MKQLLLIFINPSKSGIGKASVIVKFGFAFVTLISSYIVLNVFYSAPSITFIPRIGVLTFFSLNLFFLVGSLFPVTLSTLFLIEDYPLSSGGKVNKSINFLCLLIISYSISSILIHLVRLILGNLAGGKWDGIFSMLQLIYFVILLCGSSTSIFNIRMKKSFIITIPFVFIFLLFYLEIVLVRSFFNKVPAQYLFVFKLKPVEYFVLIVLLCIPLALLIIKAFKGEGSSRLVQQHRFYQSTSFEDLTSEDAYNEAFDMIQQGSFEEALKRLDKALDQGNVKTDAYMKRAEVLLKLKRYEDAAADVETYLESKTKTVSVEPYSMLIDCYASLENSEW